MTKWVRCASCLLPLLAGMVLQTSAQTAKAPVQALARVDGFGDSEYRIGAEDVVEVFVADGDELGVTAVVRPDGKITMKMVGEIVAEGKTAKDLASEIQKGLTPFMEGAKVNVVVKEVNSPKVSVSGEVRKPDVYRIKQKTSILDAVALAGGFTEYAKKDKVLVIRPGQPQLKLNVEKMLRDKNGDVFYIQPGDTVYVQ